MTPAPTINPVATRISSFRPCPPQSGGVGELVLKEGFRPPLHQSEPLASGSSQSSLTPVVTRPTRSNKCQPLPLRSAFFSQNTTTWESPAFSTSELLLRIQALVCRR